MSKINPNPTNLEKARREVGISRVELAKRSGVPRATIAEYEQGRNNIDNARCILVVKLADALGVPVKKILNNYEGGQQ